MPCKRRAFFIASRFHYKKEQQTNRSIALFAK